MQILDRVLRGQLERTVLSAREVAENGARAALAQLGVGEAEAYVHLSAKERQLRRELRAHGRQLGDRRHNGNGRQETNRLCEEAAYEYWHGMLFARFLAENDLLMYFSLGEPIAITLEECDDLAVEQGFSDRWEVAAHCAARMLPGVFRTDSPVFSLSFPPEYRQRLERLVEDLPSEVFTASDSLGWVYQFWQAKRKSEINASETKIGERDLAPVTQLFTEPYMVSFLLDNSLGAWWAARRLSQNDLQDAESEVELRTKARIPGFPLEYLRFVQSDQGTWTPAAGTFKKWPTHLGDLKILDPCCGSGHFLVAALHMLVPMRVELESLSVTDAVDRVISENLYGLELDPRCVQIAAFALALAAWRYPGTSGYRTLPELNIACCGLSVGSSRDEWKALAGEDHDLRIALDFLHDIFKDAPLLGSLINPSASPAVNLVHWDRISNVLVQALEKEEDVEKREIGVVAKGLARASSLLAGQYHLVVTNVPYLARGKQDEELKSFCATQYPEAKNDLATVFLDRCLEFCVHGGTVSIVLPQNWLFLTSYRKLRERLLREETWHMIARLGPQGFQTPMWDFNVQLLIMSQGRRLASEGLFDAAGRHLIRGLDVSELRSPQEKATALTSAEIKSVEQAKQLGNPDARVLLVEVGHQSLLSDIAEYGKGSTTGDSPRFLMRFWEFPELHESHVYWLNSPNGQSPWSGRSQVCKVPLEDGELRKQLGCRLHGQNVIGKAGIVVNKMRELEPFLYSGHVFDDNVCPICPNDPCHVAALWVYAESGKLCEEVRTIDQALKVTAGTLTKPAFDLGYWTRVAAERYPNGLPKPYSNDPTQWIFHGHPCGNVIWSEQKKWTDVGPLRVDDTVLQVAVARLLGYSWPAEFDDEMELADEQRDWVRRSKSFLAYADKDGIVSIPPVRGEVSAADRLLDMLAAAYGDEWNTGVLNRLLAASDCAGRSLKVWMRDKFFAQHCKLFQHRPFIWHIWDGLNDGFSVLVNYHKLDYKLFETLIYTYLGDWISQQKLNMSKGVDGAEEKLAAAENLKKRLELILVGEAPYDIFVRWKPIEEQPIGWNPDLNDGVRLNIRPFIQAQVLRHNKKPQLNINWKKDRGRDVESAPWYNVFGGERISDYHLSLKQKTEAREASRR